MLLLNNVQNKSKAVVLLDCRSVSVASRLAYDILTGLAHINSLGLVHRNLSPGDVLFDDQVLAC